MPQLISKSASCICINIPVSAVCISVTILYGHFEFEVHFLAVSKLNFNKHIKKITATSIIMKMKGVSRDGGTEEYTNKSSIR